MEFDVKMVLEELEEKKEIFRNELIFMLNLLCVVQNCIQTIK